MQMREASGEDLPDIYCDLDQAKVDNKAKIATAKAKTAQLKRDNPSMVKRAASAVGSAIRGS